MIKAKVFRFNLKEQIMTDKHLLVSLIYTTEEKK